MVAADQAGRNEAPSHTANGDLTRRKKDSQNQWRPPSVGGGFHEHD